MEEPLRQIQTIGVETALVLSKEAISTAFEGRVSGIVMVYGSDRTLLVAQAVGSKGTPTNVAVAMSKIKTVLNTRRSTRKQREFMEQEVRHRDDYADCLGSLLGGGVAIYDKPPEEEGEFVGAIAFSGGTPTQDEEICVKAVMAVRLYVDI